MIIFLGAILDPVGGKNGVTRQPPRDRTVVDEGGELDAGHVLGRHDVLLVLLLLPQIYLIAEAVGGHHCSKRKLKNSPTRELVWISSKNFYKMILYCSANVFIQKI